MKTKDMVKVVLIVISLALPLVSSVATSGSSTITKYQSFAQTQDSAIPTTTPAWSYQTIGRILPNVVCVSGDGNYIAVGTEWNWTDGYVYLFSKSSETPIWSYRTGPVKSISISSDGSYIVVGTGIPSEELDPEHRSKLYLFHRSNSTPLWVYKGFNPFYSVSISGDGNHIIALGDPTLTLHGYILKFWRYSGKPVWNYTPPSYIGSVSVSYDGRYVVVGSENKTYLFPGYGVYINGTLVGSPSWSFQANGRVNCVTISADGNYVAVGEARAGLASVHLLRRSDGELLWSYQTPSNVIWSVSISKDGSYIAAGGNYGLANGLIFFFDESSGTPLWKYKTNDTVLSLSISSDGSYVAAASRIDGIYLLSKFGIPLWRYESSPASSVSISSDGNYLVAGTADPTNKVYFFSLSCQVSLQAIDSSSHPLENARVVTNDGVFFTGVSGQVVFKAIKSNPYSISIFWEGVNVYNITLNLQEDATLNCPCQVYDLSVEVISLILGSPVAGASVQLHWKNNTQFRTLTTGSDGKLTFIQLPRSSYKIKAISLTSSEIVNITIDRTQVQIIKVFALMDALFVSIVVGGIIGVTVLIIWHLKFRRQTSKQA